MSTKKKVRSIHGKEIDAPEYNPDIIVEFAARLYKKAADCITSHTIGGAILGLILGGILAQNALVAIMAAITGGIIGYMYGVEKSFELKLKAQTALCQMQIAENTKR